MTFGNWHGNKFVPAPEPGAQAMTAFQPGSPVYEAMQAEVERLRDHIQTLHELREYDRGTITQQRILIEKLRNDYSILKQDYDALRAENDRLREQITVLRELRENDQRLITALRQEQRDD